MVPSKRQPTHNLHIPRQQLRRELLVFSCEKRHAYIGLFCVNRALLRNVYIGLFCRLCTQGSFFCGMYTQGSFAESIHSALLRNIHIWLFLLRTTYTGLFCGIYTCTLNIPRGDFGVFHFFFLESSQQLRMEVLASTWLILTCDVSMWSWVYSMCVLYVFTLCVYPCRELLASTRSKNLHAYFFSPAIASSRRVLWGNETCIYTALSRNLFEKALYMPISSL